MTSPAGENLPKRRPGRPPDPLSPTSAERMRASRQARRSSTVELPRALLDRLDARMVQQGDASRAALIERLEREAG